MENYFSFSPCFVSMVAILDFMALAKTASSTAVTSYKHLEAL